MKVVGQLEEVALENLTSDPSNLFRGRIWLNTTSYKAKIKGASTVLNFLLNDQNLIVGTNGTAATNVRINRAAVGTLQFVTADDVTAEGTLATTLLGKLSFKFESYTTVGKPAFGNAGRVIWDTTLNVLSADTGAAWTNIGGTPDDLSVSTAKIQNNAVTTGKLALGFALGLTTVTADVTDFVVLSDTSDSGNAKKALVSDFAGNGFFGSGADGDVTITTNNLTSGTWIAAGVLQRDVFFNNLTISGSGSINTNCFRIFVAGTLDISNAGAKAIKNDGNAGNAGAATTTAGTGGAQITGTTLPGSFVGPTGGVGGTVNGSQAAVVSVTVAVFNPLQGSSGGAGGLGNSTNTGGAIRDGGVATNVNNTYPRLDFYNPTYYMLFGFNGFDFCYSGNKASGGGGGGGDGTAGGGGGGAGTMAPHINIYAKIINRGASTTAGAISAQGGVGGAGGTAAAGSRGGGGGGGGGTGGVIYVIYGSVTGATATNAFDASGGTGGAGGNGTAAAKASGGTGGTGGVGGTIFLQNMTTGAATYSQGGAGTTATLSTTTAGTAGGAGNSVKVSL